MECGFDGTSKYIYVITILISIVLCHFCTPGVFFIIRVTGMSPIVEVGCVLMLLGFLWVLFSTH